MYSVFEKYCKVMSDAKIAKNGISRYFFSKLIENNNKIDKTGVKFGVCTTSLDSKSKTGKILEINNIFLFN